MTDQEQEEESPNLDHDERPSLTDQQGKSRAGGSSTPQKTAARRSKVLGCSSVDCDHELPLWCSRPFCRSNTQSEPEDVFCGGHSSCPSDGVEQTTTFAYSGDEDDLPECHRGCSEYYYLSARGGGSRDGAGREKREYDFGDAFVKANPSEDDSESGESSPNQARPAAISFGSGFALIFFVALPMLARHLGALISKRLLARLYRS